MPPQHLAGGLAGFQIVCQFRRLRTCLDQRLHRGAIVSRFPVPTVFGAVKGGPYRRDFMLAVQFELRVVPQNLPNHFRVSMPRRPLQGRHLIVWRHF